MYQKFSIGTKVVRVGDFNYGKIGVVETYSTPFNCYGIAGDKYWAFSSDLKTIRDFYKDLLEL